MVLTMLVYYNGVTILLLRLLNQDYFHYNEYYNNIFKLKTQNLKLKI